MGQPRKFAIEQGMCRHASSAKGRSVIMILLSARPSDPDMARDEDEAAQMAATLGANVYRFQTEDLKRGSSNAMGTDLKRTCNGDSTY